MPSPVARSSRRRQRAGASAADAGGLHAQARVDASVTGTLIERYAQADRARTAAAAGVVAAEVQVVEAPVTLLGTLRPDLQRRLAGKRTVGAGVAGAEAVDGLVLVDVGDRDRHLVAVRIRHALHGCIDPLVVRRPELARCHEGPAAVRRPVALAIRTAAGAVGARNPGKRLRLRALAGAPVAETVEALVGVGAAGDRVRTRAHALLAGVGLGAGVAVVAGGAVGLGRVNAPAGGGITHSGVVTLIGGAALRRAAAAA